VPSTTKTYAADARRVLLRHAEDYPKAHKRDLQTAAGELAYAKAVRDHIQRTADELAGLFPPPRLQHIHTAAYHAVYRAAAAWAQCVYDVEILSHTTDRAVARLLRTVRRTRRPDERALETLVIAVSSHQRIQIS
jgi:hypothetical protein